MHRSQSRVIKLSKQKIEKDIEKLKRRMNRIYVEILSRQEALKLFEAPKPEEAASKEQELRKEVVKEIEALEANEIVTEKVAQEEVK